MSTEAKTRICTCCKKELPMREFGKSTTTADKIQKRCFACNRAASHEKRERERMRALEEIKRTSRSVTQRFTNGTTSGIYTPPGRAYYRNNGHKHIPSAGYSC